VLSLYKDTAATEQVQNAYESVAFGKGRPSDVLDLSEEGTSWWASSMSHYNSKVNGLALYKGYHLLF
jgi:hypothetical protein